MALQNAHFKFPAATILRLLSERPLSYRVLLLLIFIVSAQTFESSLVYAKDALITGSPPQLDIEAAKNREQDRLATEVKENTEIKNKLSINSKGAEPIQDTSISLKPVINVAPQTKESLERQFQKIQTLLETENAFSEKLGENYFSYGKLLIQVARIDDAKEAFINALHIAKVNNGVESIEQRPMLRELFEISYAQKDLKETDLIAKRIIFLEKKRPENDDPYAFDILMRLGHLHMNLFLDNPSNGYEGLSSINRAMKHFEYVLARYGDQPMSQVLMPYGELAFLWYLKNEIRLEVNNDIKRGTRQLTFSQIDKSRYAVTPERARAKGLKILNDYYQKAFDEGDLENVVRALLNTGDLNIIYARQAEAQQFYIAAWERAKLLPDEHPLLKSFDKPVKLPNFKYALKSAPPSLDKEYYEVPLRLSININGRVKGIQNNVDHKQYGSSLMRAKRLIKKFKFRPILENGKPLKVSETEYVVKLSIKPKRS